MTKALSEALARRPPRGNGTGEAGASNAVATSAVSTTAQSIGQTANGSGFFITMKATQDCFVRFGKSTVGAATTSDYLLTAGVAEEFWCESVEDTHFTAIRSTADGFLFWFRSSR